MCSRRGRGPDIRPGPAGQPELGARHAAPLATRAERLPVPGLRGPGLRGPGLRGQAVVEPQLAQHLAQIGDLHGAGEWLAAARTDGLPARGARLLVQLDADLRRTLDDVEQLAERQ